MDKVQTFFFNSAQRGVSTSLACKRRAEHRDRTLTLETSVPAPQSDLHFWGARPRCGGSLRRWSVGSRRRATDYNRSVVLGRGGGFVPARTL